METSAADFERFDKKTYDLVPSFHQDWYEMVVHELFEASVQLNEAHHILTEASIRYGNAVAERIRFFTEVFK